MAELILLHGHVALIDDIDLERVNEFTWHLSRKSPKHHTVYVRKNTNPRVFLHRFIMNAPQGVLVDHKNGNGLDNRRSNLRLCSHAENARNHRIRGGRKFTGPAYDQRANRFYVRIGGQYHGCFSTELEAALAYDKAARERFGEFARLNFPESQ